MHAAETALYFIAEHLLTVSGFLLAIVLIGKVLRDPRPTGGAMAWVLAIALVPYAGVPLYLIFGGRKLRRLMRSKAKLYPGPAMPAPEGRYAGNVERLLASAGMPPASEGNEVRLVWDGQEAYHELIAMLEGAKETIHAMTFILGRDEVGRAIVDTLARKAREGVKVRLLLDSLGCLKTKGRFVNAVRAAGGEVEIFLPMLPLRRTWSANLRNHRKIVVVDGDHAMMGGMNLSRNFMGPTPDPKRYADCAVFFRGPGVQDVETIFAQDWHYTTERTLTLRPMDAAARAALPKGPDTVLQVMASGPDVREDVLLDAFLTAAMGIRERIWIVTPYLVPDESIVKALEIQARMGRDVRLILPRHSNHLTADLARGLAVRSLARAGAKIYGYEKGMLHAKAMLFDHRIAITGSPNLDMRSFYFNFESALLHYAPDEIADVEAWMQTLLQDCKPLDTRRPSASREWLEGMCNLISPLL